MYVCTYIRRAAPTKEPARRRNKCFFGSYEQKQDEDEDEEEDRDEDGDGDGDAVLFCDVLCFA